MSTTRIRHHFRIATLWLVAFAAPAWSGVNTWTPVGPGGGQARAVAFHPTQAGVMFTAAGYSIYRSTDGGQTWVSVYDGVPDIWTRFVFDPANASRIMMSAGNNLWRSDDGGLSFHVALGPTLNTSYQTLAIAADGAVYVATLPGDVFRSTDFGSTWIARSPGLPSGDFVRDLVVDPQNAASLYALTYQNGLFRSTNAGGNWTQLSAPPFSAKIAVDPGDSAQLLIAANGGVYASQNSGATWTLDVAGGSYSWIGYHPSAASRVGAAVALGDRSPTLRRSSRTDPWLAGVTLTVRSEDAAFDPLDTDLVNTKLLFASAAGPLYTQNGGVSYTVLAQGIQGATASALAADNVHGAVYAAFQSGAIGIWRRSGSTWAEVDNTELFTRVPAPFLPFGLAAHGDTVFLGSVTGLVRSLDSGQSWGAPYPGLGGGQPRALAFAPSNPQTLYLGNDGQGVLRTDDQGVVWVPRSNGAPPGIGAIAVDAVNPNVAYLGDRYGTAPAVLYKTTDGGVSWLPAVSGLNAQAIESLASTPNAQALYAGAVGNGQGVFKSTDGAVSWQRVGAPIGNAAGSSIAIDPVVPTNLVTASSSNGAARSVDAGATWEQLPFLTRAGNLTYAIRHVTLDPRRPNVIIGSAYEYGLVEFEVSPDLEATISSAPAALALDGNGTATIRVRNRGPLAASAVRLRLTAPAGATLVGAAPAQGACAAASGVLTCALGAIPVNQTVDTALNLRGGNAPASGNLSAYVEAHESDSALANNSASTAVPTARTAELGITLARSAAQVDTGAPVVFTATATNQGPNPSDSSSVVVTLGAGLTYRSAAATQGSCAQTAGTVTCALGRLDSGQQAVATIEAAGDIAGTSSANAVITDAALDPVTQNNSAAASVTVGTLPTLVNNPGGGGGGYTSELDLALLLALLGLGRAARERARRRGTSGKSIA